MASSPGGSRKISQPSPASILANPSTSRKKVLARSASLAKMIVCAPSITARPFNHAVCQADHEGGGAPPYQASVRLVVVSLEALSCPFRKPTFVVDGLKARLNSVEFSPAIRSSGLGGGPGPHLSDGVGVDPESGRQVALVAPGEVQQVAIDREHDEPLISWFEQADLAAGRDLGGRFHKVSLPIVAVPRTATCESWSGDQHRHRWLRLNHRVPGQSEL